MTQLFPSLFQLDEGFLLSAEPRRPLNVCISRVLVYFILSKSFHFTKGEEVVMDT